MNGVYDYRWRNGTCFLRWSDTKKPTATRRYD